MNQRLRYERKFRVEELNRYKIENLIKSHPALFSEIFQERQVNNIYFDTNNLKNYFENLDGASHRYKIRIRWYGNLIGFVESPFLEIKVKKEYVGEKIRFPLKSFVLDNNFSIKKMHKLFSKSNIPKPLQEELKTLNFSLSNSYLRKYYISADKNYRLTLDHNMEFINLNKENPTFSRRYEDNSLIVELKYSPKQDFHAQVISNKFPFRMTKNSKYVYGINLLHHNDILG